MGTFERYGYVPLEPPSVEFARAATTVVDEHRVLRFLDRDGSLLALRPDVTTAVARVVSQRYRDASGALRLAYFTPVFRQERSMRGSEREYDQAGVELIGPTGVVADAEVLALLCDALSALGLRSFTVEVGHIGAVRGLFAGLPAAAAETVLDHLRRSDLVGAFRAAAEAGMPSERLDRARRALAVRGRAIETVGDLPHVGELRETIHLAREMFPFEGGEPRVEGATLWGVPDLGVIPALPYYTGVVFEVVSPHAGAPIAAGGRYDGLLARYGPDRPATGFGIAVPLLHQALLADGWKAAFDAPLVSVEGGTERDRLRVAAVLRGRGLLVALGPVAEAAGRSLRVAQVVDARHIRVDGRDLTLDAASDVLAQGARR